MIKNYGKRNGKEMRKSNICREFGKNEKENPKSLSSKSVKKIYKIQSIIIIINNNWKEE